MQTKIIIQADLARHLLSKGFQIVDIKAKKENPHETIFVFKVDDGFFDILKSWKK